MSRFRTCWGLVVVLATPLLLGVSAGVAAAAALQPRIVNGLTTAEYPAVGILYNTSGTFCSGTMIGCQTFLTAAHCVCPSSTDTASTCLARGGAQPDGWTVFLAQGGIFEVTSVTIDPSYDFAVGGDVAVLRLGAAMDGVPPVPINTTTRPPFGTSGTIVGFGRTGGNPTTNVDFGVKRWGRMVTAACDHVPDAANLCWPFTRPVGPVAEDSNTCQGDSGGPMFVDVGAGPALAGVTSGGVPDDCLSAPDGESFNTDVFVHREFVRSVAGSDLDHRACGSLPQVGTAGATVYAFEGTLDALNTAQRYTFEVPAGTARLRVGLNQQAESRSGTNDFDLYVRAGAPPTRDVYDCRDFRARPFAFCELEAPAAGRWHVLVDRFKGQGTAQVVATVFAALAPVCAGDCSGDGQVTVDDLVLMVSIANGVTPLAECPAGDANGYGQITVDDLVAAAGNALEGCGGRAWGL